MLCSSIRFLSGEVSAMLVRAFRLIGVAVVSADRSLSDILACTVHGAVPHLFAGCSGLCKGDGSDPGRLQWDPTQTFLFSILLSTMRALGRNQDMKIMFILTSLAMLRGN